MSAMPYWPLMMKRATAAAYCDLTVAEFEREVAAATLPLPVNLGNHEHWSRTSLDRALALLTGDVEEDWRIGSPLYRDAAA